MNLQTVVHNIPPLYDSESRVLLLGSIPAQNRARRAFSTPIHKTVSGGFFLPYWTRSCPQPQMKSAPCASGITLRCGTRSPAVILPVHRIRALKMPCRTISAACCTRRRSPGFLRPAASPPSCTADWSSRRSIFPSHSCPPPVRQTPHGLLRS